MDEIQIDRSEADIGVGGGQRGVRIRRQLAADVGMAGRSAGARNVPIKGRDVTAGRNRRTRDGIELVGPTAERQILRHEMESGQAAADRPARLERHRSRGRRDADRDHIVGPDLKAGGNREGREGPEE